MLSNLLESKFQCLALKVVDCSLTKCTWTWQCQGYKNHIVTRECQQFVAEPDGAGFGWSLCLPPLWLQCRASCKGGPSRRWQRGVGVGCCWGSWRKPWPCRLRTPLRRIPIWFHRDPIPTSSRSRGSSLVPDFQLQFGVLKWLHFLRLCT